MKQSQRESIWACSLHLTGHWALIMISCAPKGEERLSSPPQDQGQVLIICISLAKPFLFQLCWTIEIQILRAVWYKFWINLQEVQSMLECLWVLASLPRCGLVDVQWFHSVQEQVVQWKHTGVLCVNLLPSPGFTISSYNNNIRGSRELSVVEGDQPKGMERTLLDRVLRQAPWKGAHGQVGKASLLHWILHPSTSGAKRWALLGHTKDLSVPYAEFDSGQSLMSRETKNSMTS